MKMLSTTPVWAMHNSGDHYFMSPLLCTDEKTASKASNSQKCKPSEDRHPRPGRPVGKATSTCAPGHASLGTSKKSALAGTICPVRHPSLTTKACGPGITDRMTIGSRSTT